MKTWQPLSGQFTAANGLVVEPVGSQETLIEMGRHFHNGLMVHSDMWAGQCQRGKRQIYRVLDAQGVMVANGEFEVKGGEVKTMFVRGHGNVDFGPGEPAYDAVAGYLEAVNGRAITLDLVVTQDGFANQAEPELSPWQQAVKAAKAKMISPFLALITGGVQAEVHDRDVKRLNPEADPVEELTWNPLSAAFRAPGGFVVEPIGSRTGLRTLGEELENNLIVMHGSYAETCSRGQTQFAAIYTEKDGIVAFAELRPVAGMIVPAACRGRFDAEAPAGAVSALMGYIAAVNGRLIETSVGIGPNGFLMDGQAPAANPFEGNPSFDASATLGQSMRTAGYSAAYGDDGDDEDEGFEDDEDLEDEEDLEADDNEDEDEAPAEPITWQALTDDFVAPNGLTVQVVTNQETLREMGLQFSNALSQMHGMWANHCARGTSQIVRVLDGNGDMVANVEVGSRDGELYAKAGVLREHNGPASPEAHEAFYAWCAAVRDRRVALHGEVTETGFRFAEPTQDNEARWTR